MTSSLVGSEMCIRDRDNFVHKLFTSLLIYYHAFYSMMFVFVFHEVKNKTIPNN
ncbi:hypothetical protein ACX3VG_26380 [Escherichia coli]